MTPRDRFKRALERKPLEGRVPTFELVFFLTMEKFGRIHHSQRNFYQWDQMSESERILQRRDNADLSITIAREYGHSAIFARPPVNDFDEMIRNFELIREQSGDRYFL
ncbi:MAG: hypothetical protein R3232_12710, partial [Clostridia bacterium]|nr:hypothetical protein [Clostridia bacterium]